jgi:hypothetical protein
LNFVIYYVENCFAIRIKSYSGRTNGGFLFFAICHYLETKAFFFRPCFFISIFWVINGILYFPEIFSWEWYANATNDITYYYNLLETCQIILIFYLIFKKATFKFLLFIFIIFEVIMTYRQGKAAGVVIIGVGCFISLILNTGAVIRYVFKPEPSNIEHALVFVYAGFAFYFTQFIITYTFNYLQFSTSTLPYIAVINYSSICIATSPISFGMAKHPVSQSPPEYFPSL